MTAFAPILLAGCLLAVVTFPPAPPTHLNDARTTPPNAARLAAAARYDQKLGATVPLDATFRDESGRVMPLGAYLGQRPAILVLGYHECPMLCSLVLGGLVETLTEMRATTGKDFDLIDVSINPADTPAMADKQRRMYFKRYLRDGADAGWHFLTSPDEGQVRRLADAVGFRYAYDPASKQFSHPSGFVVLTPEGTVSRYFFGVTYDAGQVQGALAEAGQRRVGSRVAELLLVCFHYNPIHGRYGALIMNILRAAGALMLVAMGWLIFQLNRRTARTL